MEDFRIVGIDSEIVAITTLDKIIYANKEKLLRIDIPTSWDKQSLGASSYITCNRGTGTIRVADTERRISISVSQTEYTTALRKFKYRYVEGEDR